MIENTQLGPNSWAIHYDQSNSIEILTAIKEVLPQSGWEIYDDNSGANTCVFRAPMIDDPDIFKYVRISLATVNYVLTEVYEDWNNETHVGINLAIGSNLTQFDAISGAGSAFNTIPNNQALSFSSATLFIFINERYLMIWGRNSSGLFNSQGPTGCIEITKDNPQEVTGDYPRFIFTTAAMCLNQNMRMTTTAATEPYHNILATGSNQVVHERCASLPRGAFNSGLGKFTNLSVGILGDKTKGTWNRNVSGGSTSNTLFGTQVAQSSFANYTQNLFRICGISEMMFGNNPWDDNKLLAHNMYLYDHTEATRHMRGRLMGPKLCGSAGNNMDKIVDVLCDDNLIQVSENGTPVDHWICQVMNTNIRFILPV